jgi:hypothetical protein
VLEMAPAAKAIDARPRARPSRSESDRRRMDPECAVTRVEPRAQGPRPTVTAHRSEVALPASPDPPQRSPGRVPS